MITFGLAGPQCCFGSLKCVVQATLFQVMSVGFLVCTCICVRISLVRVHSAHPQWSGPRLHSVLLRKGCVCVCTFVLVKLTTRSHHRLTTIATGQNKMEYIRLEFAFRIKCAWSILTSHRHDLTIPKHPSGDRLKLLGSTVTPLVLRGRRRMI